MRTRTSRWLALGTLAILVALAPPVLAQRSPAELASSMAEAQALARDGLERFLAALDQEEGSQFSIKVPVRERGPFTHVWLTDLRRNGDRISGTERMPSGSGLPRTVDLADVIDWTYRHDGFTHGAFTACVANPSQPPLPFD